MKLAVHTAGAHTHASSHSYLCLSTPITSIQPGQHVQQAPDLHRSGRRRYAPFAERGVRERRAPLRSSTKERRSRRGCFGLAGRPICMQKQHICICPNKNGNTAMPTPIILLKTPTSNSLHTCIRISHMGESHDASNVPNPHKLSHGPVHWHIRRTDLEWEKRTAQGRVNTIRPGEELQFLGATAERR